MIDINSDNDRGNLIFILSRAAEGDDVLEDFLNTLDDDNLEYARDLLADAVKSRHKLVDDLFN